MLDPGRPTENDSPRAFALGAYRVVPETGEIESGGRRRRVEPKVMAVLEYLVARGGRVVSKEELLAAVWPDCIVTEDVLWRTVSELRRALGDDSRAPRYIETLPRRGYRLVVEPRFYEPEAPNRARHDAPRARWAVFVIAATLVLALVSFSSQRRTPAAGKLASETEVDRLYRVAADYYWREDRSDLERAIGLYQQALAIEPNHALSLAGLSNAYCVRETHYGAGAEWIDAAIETAHRALSIDPRLPEAHRALALAYAGKGRLRAAVAASLRAIELRPDYSAAMANLAAQYRSVGELELSRLWFSRLRSTPRERRIHLVGRGRTLALLGDMGAARGAFGRALEAQPFQPFATAQLVRIDLVEGQVGAARRRIARALAVHPDSGICLNSAAEVEHVAGDLTAARQLLERALRNQGELPWPETLIRLASLRTATGAPDRAAALLTPFTVAPPSRNDERWFRSYHRAAAWTVLGDHQSALVWLERAVRAGFRDDAWLRTEPIFDPLRELPEFESLLREIRSRVVPERRDPPRAGSGWQSVSTAVPGLSGRPPSLPLGKAGASRAPGRRAVAPYS